MFVVGTCIANIYVEVAGAAAVAVGLILFVLWAIFCSALTACGVMLTVQCLLFWIVAVVGPIMAALAAYASGIFSACTAAAALTWGGWGTLLAWLETIMRKVHCEPRSCI